MNPVEMESLVRPVVGPDIASALARAARVHKNTGGVSISVPSWVLVVLGEKLAELAKARA